MALLEKPTVDVHGPIEPEAARAALRRGKWLDDQALQMVVQDAQRAENYENQKQWVMMWPTATALYQSPFQSRYWEGTQVERANIPFFTVATAVNSLVPQVINGLFYENPPFIVQKRPGTKSQAARAVGAVLGYQLEDINFREELRLGCVNAVLFGTSIWKIGFETFTQTRKEYARKQTPMTVKNPLAAAGAPDIQVSNPDQGIEEVLKTEYIDRPVFEHVVNLRHVLVDPGLSVPDIRKAKYVVHRLYMTWEDLDKLRDRPGFDIPSQQELLELFLPPQEEPEQAPAENAIKNPLWDARAEARYEPTTIDPFNQPLEVLERWDGQKYMVVLQKKVVICNDYNPYGVIPFLSVNWWDVPEAFWGMGLAKTIGSEQRLQQAITNTWLDQASLNLNGVYVRVRGKNIPTQSIRITPGKIIEVDDKDAFKPLDRSPAVPEAGQHIVMSAARAEQVSGANEVSSQGIAGSTGHSNLARSAAGANLIASGAGNRTADFVEKLANQVVIPFLDFAHEQNCALLPEETWKHILGEELEHEFMADAGADMIELMNAKVRFSILAASKMQARRNMAQALPLMVQFLTSPETSQQLAIAGKKVDVSEVLRMYFEVSDWKNYNDVVVDMTPQDQQRLAAMQQSTQLDKKAQLTSKLEEQKHQNKQEELDQENTARAARDVLRHVFEASATPEAITGQPGGQGFDGLAST